MTGKIVYRFETPAYPGNILYVNLIANYSCISDCLFCSRPRDRQEFGKPNIYEKKADSFLYLPKSPSIDEIMASIDSEIKENDQEVAIIGLGEPLIYLPKVVEVLKRVKKKYEIRTRVDTNGLVKSMYENPTDQLIEAGLDEVRISLNAVTEEEYNQSCRPKVKNAFSNLVEFVRECVSSGIETKVSFVVGFHQKGIKKRTPKEYLKYGQSLGIKKEKIILRKYIPPV